MEELLRYVRRKLDMSRELPRESRLFANEILQGAPRMEPHLRTVLRPLFERTAGIIRGWIEAERLAPVDPHHLIFSIWATTQHYADFEAQVGILMDDVPVHEGAEAFLDRLYRRLLSPGT